MASTRTPLFVILTAVGMAACSLFTSLDGLSGGADAGSESDASSDVVTDVLVADAGSDAIALSDAQTGLLACDAAGLVAYFPLDEGSGSVVHDCHQGLVGTFGGDAGGPHWGTRGSGIDLEFTNDSFVTFGVQGQLQLAGPFTVAGWFRPDNDPTDDTSLFWDFSGGPFQGFEITLNSVNNFYAQVGDGTQNTTVAFTPPTLGTWVHAAVVYEPGVRFETFINGASVGKTTVNSAGGPLVNAAPCTHEARLASNYSTTSWTGGIDDVRIFSRALDQSEIEQLAAQ
jgi:Concanavalin A-like lectin/glucanases superfamily